MAGDSGCHPLCWSDTMVRTKVEVQSEQSGSAFFQERTCITFTVAKHTAHAFGGRHVVVLLYDQSPKGEIQLAHAKRCMSTDRKTTATSCWDIEQQVAHRAKPPWPNDNFTTHTYSHPPPHQGRATATTFWPTSAHPCPTPANQSQHRGHESKSLC